jgi:hypothetical protein
MIRRWHEVPVPYITAWSTEVEAADEHAKLLTVRTSVTHGQFAPRVSSELIYTDERPSDRDAHGLLWNRMPDDPGTGRPLFGAVHPIRERGCMLSGACQICAGPATVWMTPTDRWTDHVDSYRPSAPFTTADPPVCTSCAELAVRHCPKLAGQGWVLLTADRWAPTAVRGLKADAGTATFQDPESMITLPGVTPPPDPAALRLFIAMVLMATLWQPTVLADPADSPGLGTNLAPLHPRPAHA